MPDAAKQEQQDASLAEMPRADRTATLTLRRLRGRQERQTSGAEAREPDLRHGSLMPRDRGEDCTSEIGGGPSADTLQRVVSPGSRCAWHGRKRGSRRN